jgi:hypothetical protein
MQLLFALATIGLSFGVKAEKVKKIPQNVVNAYSPYTHYAAAAECPRKILDKWKCGSTWRACSPELDTYLLTIADRALRGQSEL